MDSSTHLSTAETRDFSVTAAQEDATIHDTIIQHESSPSTTSSSYSAAPVIAPLSLETMTSRTPDYMPAERAHDKAADFAHSRPDHTPRSTQSHKASHFPSSTTIQTKPAAVTRAANNPPSLTTGPHYNSNQLTTAEEYALFRRRYGVSSSYQGRVVVEEDSYVTCCGCGGAVDPVERVPAGKLFFHPRCISCALCGLHRGDVTHPFVQAEDQAICQNCSARGFAPCVGRPGR